MDILSGATPLIVDVRQSGSGPGEDGTLPLPETHAVGLEDAADALAKIATKHTRGKLVLAIS